MSRDADHGEPPVVDWPEEMTIPYLPRDAASEGAVGWPRR